MEIFVNIKKCLVRYVGHSIQVYCLHKSKSFGKINHLAIRFND